MTTQPLVSQSALHRQLTTPLLFLSSEGCGWEDVIVRAYHEPMELDGWIESVVPEAVLVLMTRGAMLIEQRRGDSTWKGSHFREGTFSLKAGGSAPNELRWRSLSDEPMQTLHIHLSSDLLARTAEELSGHDFARMTLVGRGIAQDPLVTQIGMALWREVEQPSVAGKLYAQTAAQMLAVHLLRHYASVAVDIKEPQQGLTRQQVRHLTEFIRAHLTENLSLDELAQQVGFSAYHFARLFRRATGASPHQYVLVQRLERAKRLLRMTDMPLTQIALESGFANQSHLAQVFKRHLGLTPKAYRQRAHF